MKKRVLTLFLALAMCLGLAVPALADDAPDYGFQYGSELVRGDAGKDASGDGWSYNSATRTLTLSGVQCDAITVSMMGDCTIVLADGTTNVAQQLCVNLMGNVTIKGSGTLILKDSPLAALSVWVAMEGATLTVQEPLTMKGGTPDNIYPITGQKDKFSYLNYLDENGNHIKYAVIAPGGSQPQPSEPTAVAYATSYSILVDGQAVDFDAYALKDENGNDTNYLKLRDLAYVLNGTDAQFNVDWDAAASAITVTTDIPYTTVNGSEMSTPFSGNQSYRPNEADVMVNGAPADLAAITLTDANGNGYTYFMLRELGQALGFGVDWDQAAGAIIINTRG